MLRNQSRQLGSDFDKSGVQHISTSNSSMQADPVKQRTGDINVMSANDMVKIA